MSWEAAKFACGPECFLCHDIRLGSTVGVIFLHLIVPDQWKVRIKGFWLKPYECDAGHKTLEHMIS